MFVYNDGYCTGQFAFQMTGGQPSVRARITDHNVTLAFVQFNQGARFSVMPDRQASGLTVQEGPHNHGHTLFCNHMVLCRRQSVQMIRTLHLGGTLNLAEIPVAKRKKCQVY